MDEKKTVEKKEQRRYQERASRLDNVMAYMWTGKDIGWYFASASMAFPFAALAMILSLSITFHAAWHKYYASAVNNFCVSMWLFGNFIWMIPEVDNPNNPTYYTSDVQTDFNGWAEMTFIAAILLILTQLLVLRPLGIVTNPSDSSSSASESASASGAPAASYHEQLGLVPHFVPSKLVIGYGSGPCHAQLDLNFEVYHNLHFLFWVLKDVSWVSHTLPLWFIAVFFTVSISMDFIVTCFTAGYTFDALHHVGTALWLSGNIVWSFGELWGLGLDSPPSSVFSLSEAYTYRYWAVLMVILSIVPYIIAYCLECGFCGKRAGLPRTLSGVLTSEADVRGKEEDSRLVEESGTSPVSGLGAGAGGGGVLTSRPRLRSVCDVPDDHTPLLV